MKLIEDPCFCLAPTKVLCELPPGHEGQHEVGGVVWVSQPKSDREKERATLLRVAKEWVALGMGTQVRSFAKRVVKYLEDEAS